MSSRPILSFTKGKSNLLGMSANPEKEKNLSWGSLLTLLSIFSRIQGTRSRVDSPIFRVRDSTFCSTLSWL